MNTHGPAPVARGAAELPRCWKPLSLGFLYWLAFVLVLEPDNALRAFQASYRLGFDHEAARMVAAAMLGAPTVPLILRLTRRCPVRGATAWRNALIHFLSYLVLAASLILISCFLAAWAFGGHLIPTVAQVRTQLIANETLLVYALCGLAAVAHVIEGRQQPNLSRSGAPQFPYPAQIPVKVAGRLRFVTVSDVDWIEAQGNYVALHAAKDTHLVRRTLTDIESGLGRHDFVRIHRRLIVAVGKIQEMKSLPTGDARVKLRDGTELKVSRRYRAPARDRWAHYQRLTAPRQSDPVGCASSVEDTRATVSRVDSGEPRLQS